jgi:hypothetical protein
VRDQYFSMTVLDVLALSGGCTIILLEGLGSKITAPDRSRNVISIDVGGNINWRIRSDFDLEGNPFTRIYLEEGQLMAYRWDGGAYSIDVITGFATPMRLDR